MQVVVTGGSGKGGTWVVRDLREQSRRPQRRHASRRQRLRAVPDRDLTDLGQAQDALSGADAVVHFAANPAPAAARRRDIPDQRAVDLQRLRGGRRPPRPPRRLGFVRDGARAAVRHPARVRASRRDHRAAARDVVYAVEARRRDHGGAAGAAHRDRVHRPADLEHHGPRGLRDVPDLAGRRDHPQVEPVGLRGCTRRRAGGAPRSRRRSTVPRYASSRPPTPSWSARAPTSWPRSFPPSRCGGRWRARDAPRHRPRASPARLRTSLPLAGAARLMAPGPAHPW